MEIKKSTHASMKGKQTLFFLIGLNLVLIAIWLLFGIQTKIESLEIAEIQQTNSPSGIILDIDEPLTPEPEPEVETPEIPEPEIDLTEVVETPEPVLNQPKIADANTPKIPVYIPSSSNNGDILKKLDSVKIKAATVKERVPEPVTANFVSKMAVYPGCEKFEDKTELLNCFSEKLRLDILDNLDREFPRTDKNEVKVQLRFNVNTKGEIVDIEPVGDKEFQLQAKKALEKVNAKLQKNGKSIRPAKMADNTDAILKFQSNVVLQKP